MKIGFSTFVLQGGRTGVASYIINLLDYLQQDDHENDVDILIGESEAKLIPVTNEHYRHKVYPNRLLHPVRNILWHNFRLPGISRHEHYDIVHIPSYRRIPRFKSTKIVATVHDLATFTIEGKYDPARMFYNRKIVPSLIRNADHVITVSHFTKQDIVRLIGYPEDKITVIYSGIHREQYHPVDTEEARKRVLESFNVNAPYMVYVSRVEHPAKNHMTLMRAFEMYKDDTKDDIQLLFAGADWNGADEVKAYAAQSRWKDDIHFLGFVALDDIPYLYSACRLMVYPSFFEGFGFPIVEAMACGAPVICSNTSSMKEIAADLVPTFNPRSPGAICAAMTQALESEWGSADRQKALDYAARFNWHDTARSVLDVYRKVGGC